MPAVVPPTGAAYDLVLLAHVLSAVVGFGSVGVTGSAAWRARRGPGGPGDAGLRRYFRPGTNWAGRVLYLTPALGFALIAMSHGAYGAGDGFVVIGLALWLAAAVVAELVVWPGERRIQAALAGEWTADDALARTCAAVTAGAVAVVGVLVAASVVMTVKP